MGSADGARTVHAAQESDRLHERVFVQCDSTEKRRFQQSPSPTVPTQLMRRSSDRLYE